ncbi:MAG: hypothetical protein KKH98_07115 [Spirochaetes bacterium]|nr:hypothetical protein [Spirochaetota bacterium]
MDKRQNIRFDPDENSLLELFKKGSPNKPNRIVGLVRDESYHGCGAIFRKNFPFKKGDKVMANVGKLTNLKAEIVWVTDVDEVFVKVGVFLS